MMLIPKSKSNRIQILVLILAGLILQPAHASVIPGRWEKASNLKVDAPITVTLKNGDQVEGHFKGLSASDVDIETHSARAKIPKAYIQTIIARTKDGLGDGAAIGAAAGAAVLGIVALIGKSWTDFDAKKAVVSAVGIGAGIGVAADASKKSEAIVLFEAPKVSQ